MTSRLVSHSLPKAEKTQWLNLPLEWLKALLYRLT
jgi:hypothetical protein